MASHELFPQKGSVTNTPFKILPALGTVTEITLKTDSEILFQSGNKV